MTDTTAEAELQQVEGQPAEDAVNTTEVEVVETPAPVAEQAAPPQATQLKVKTKKLTMVRKEDDQGVAQERADGETRTETDQSPVQMAVVTQKPREIEELQFPSIVIERIRY